MISAIFWDITKLTVAILYRLFRTTSLSHLQGSRPSWILNYPFLYINILEHNGVILSKKKWGGGGEGYIASDAEYK